MSKRLDALESLVDSKKVFDVGCDHGLLSIMLSTNHEVVASDITSSSCNIAKKNISNSHANVKVIQSDGLDKLDIKKEDTVILAGMGAYTIIKILKKNISKVPDTLILQSNNNLDILRKEIIKLGYYIDDEINLYEKRWYTIIKFKKGYRKYHNIDYIIGIKPDKKYLEYLLKIYNTMYIKIPKRCIIKRIKTYSIIKKIKGYI